MAAQMEIKTGTQLGRPASTGLPLDLRFTYMKRVEIKPSLNGLGCCMGSLSNDDSPKHVGTAI
jgi:hypothetical protein